MSVNTPLQDPDAEQARAFWDRRTILPVWALGAAVAALVLLIAYGASRVNDRFVGAPVPTPAALQNPAPTLPPGSARRGLGGVSVPPR
jgi:hypothetical protein